MLRLRLLGSGALLEGGGTFAGPAGQPRRVALLALLALSPEKTVSRDKLVAYLWPESEVERGRHRLAESVYVLRRALGEEALVSEADTIKLNSESLTCDVWDFEASLAAGDDQAAVTGYTGPFLDGFFLKDALEFERWADGERDRLARAYRGALERLAEAAEARSEHSESVQRWRSLAAEDPFSTRVVLRLIEVLERSGDRGAALQVARDHQELLRREFDAEPSPELAGWIERLTLSVGQAGHRRAAEEAVALSTAAPESGLVRERGASLARRRVNVALTALATLILLWQVIQRSPTSEPARTDAGPERIMLVVLPFVNLGAAGDQYFADGLTEEIITRLAKVAGLGVIARTSAFHYQNTDVPIGQIGDELGVQFVLEGAVRWQTVDGRQRIRVTPQLVRVSDASHVWAESYEFSPADVFNVQADMAEHVARALNVNLFHAESLAVRRVPTDVQPAYEYYLRGLAYRNRELSPQDARKAVELFEKAVKLDSTFAEAYLELAASARWLVWLYGMGEYEPKIMPAMQRGLELGPDLAQAHIALGREHYRWRRYEQAIDEFSLALKLEPSSAVARQQYGAILKRQGRWQDAVQYYEEVVRLDPFDHRVAGDLAGTYLLIRRYDEAERYFERALALAPTLEYGKNLVFLYIMRDGATEQARALLDSARLANPAEWLVRNFDETFLIRVFGREYRQEFERLTVDDFGSAQRYYMAMGELNTAVGDSLTARAYYDSACVATADDWLEMESIVVGERVRSLTRIPGLARARLGRFSEALWYAQKSVDLIPPSVDAISGVLRFMDLTQIQLLAGDYDAALDGLDYLLSIPSPMSVSILEVDPLWDPVRDHPRFQTLQQKYEGQ